MTLKQTAFKPLPLGSVKPAGWLKRQLEIQRDSLSGHLDEFWPDVGQSSWFGGEAEGWERAPYWLDGAIPLAFLLDDEALKERVTEYTRYIIEHQQSNGWIGPLDANVTNPEATLEYDVWALQLACKVLMQYHEISGDEEAIKAMQKCARHMVDHLNKKPLFNWGRDRWFEMLLSLYYLYEQTGEEWVLDVARLHYEQGFDWKTCFSEEDITVPTPRRGQWKWHKHVVNIAMAIKCYPLWWRISGDDDDRDFVNRMIELLDRYHGQVTGVFTGDECVSGKNPLQGTELCAVVEYMYSLEQVIAVLGNPAHGDRLEKITFNALPATFSPDMWAHQYDQQANQVQVTINEEYLWSTNGPDSNLYGLEPNFGCCTANMHQGWPKFTANLWMQTPDDGIATVAYAPSRASFTSHGIPVTVELDTDYPFRDTLIFTVKAESAVTFPLLLRIPAWAGNAKIVADGTEITPDTGSFYRLEREWSGTTVVTLILPMKPVASRRYNNAVSIERGPLVYSLKIEEEWKRVNEDKPWRELPHADWEVYAASAWNYALQVDENNLEDDILFEETSAGETPFSPAGAPVKAMVKGRKLPGWELIHGWAGETPISPVCSEEPLEELTLIPYGCTNLRISEFPVLE
jgi:DUF1680 family protein